MKSFNRILSCGAVAAALLPVVASAQDVARYMTPDGTVLCESPLYSGQPLFNMRPVDYGDPALGFTVTPQGYYGEGAVQEITFIPAGSVAHQIEVTEVPEDVEVTMTIIGSHGTRMPLRAGENNDLVSGTLVKLTVNIQEPGLFPRLLVNADYFNNPQYGSFMPMQAQMALPNTFWPVMSTATAEARALWVAQMTGQPCPPEFAETPGVWFKEAGDGNCWSIVVEMPNADTDLVVDYVYDIDENGQPTDNLLYQSWISQLFWEKALQQTYIAYGNFNAQFMNGEPFLGSFADDAYSNFFGRYGPSLLNMEYATNGATWMSAMPWQYALHLVDSANMVLAVGGSEFGEQRTACMRFLRGLGYLRLLQFYAPRWEDSAGGSVPCTPLYEKFGPLNAPLASMSDVIDFCRNDLEYAKAYLPRQEANPGTITYWTACGMLTRLALLCHDWQAACDNAAEVLDQFPLTSNAQMQSGFFAHQPSWVWTGTFNTYRLGYYNAQAMNAINGVYVTMWRMGTWNGAIDYNLFKTAWDISSDDIRLQQFAMPQTTKASASTFLSKANRTTMLFDAPLPVKSGFPEWIDGNMPEGYQYFENLRDYPCFQFGQQAKFWAATDNPYGGGDVCLMRADEMLLAQAEANVMLGNNAEARQLISTLSEMRGSGAESAVPTESEGLLDYIRLQRRIELWGEGQAWTDTKRWNLPVSRQAFGDLDNLGNWPEHFAFTTPADAANGWRFVIPNAALRSNPSIDIESLGYTQYSAGIPNNAPMKVSADKE